MTSAISESEFGWGGAPVWGLGDYRIPKTMLTKPNGDRIEVADKYPKKGIIRGYPGSDEEKCVLNTDWNMYKCHDMMYKMFVIESLDADTETRRLSPIAVASAGYIDLINGPQDHGWCHGYTCQERVSMFQTAVAINHHYEIYMTSYNPQKTRLMLLNANDEERIRVEIFYPKSQRLDVYKQGKAFEALVFVLGY